MANGHVAYAKREVLDDVAGDVVYMGEGQARATIRIADNALARHNPAHEARYESGLGLFRPIRKINAQDAYLAVELGRDLSFSEVL